MFVKKRLICQINYKTYKDTQIYSQRYGDVCDTAFNNPSNLQIHKITHTSGMLSLVTKKWKFSRKLLILVHSVRICIHVQSAKIKTFSMKIRTFSVKIKTFSVKIKTFLSEN